MLLLQVWRSSVSGAGNIWQTAQIFVANIRARWNARWSVGPVPALSSQIAERQNKNTSDRSAVGTYLFSPERGHSCPRQRETLDHLRKWKPCCSSQVAAEEAVHPALNTYIVMRIARKGAGRNSKEAA